MPNRYEFREDYAVIITASGIEVLCDTSDIPLLSQKTWRIHSCGKKKYVIHRPDTRKKEFTLLHRLLMIPPEGMVVDHINGDTLDNRRSNLRVTTQNQNKQNRKRAVSNQCGYKGVWFDGSKRGYKKWRAQIYLNKKRYGLGQFSTPEEAFEAYKEASARLHGEFGCIE